MNTYLLIAANLSIILGLVHSIIGEMLIFKHWRNIDKSGNVSSPNIPLRHKRIIWASWHLVSVFGMGIAALLFILSAEKNDVLSGAGIENVLAITMFVCGVVVLIGTRGKHPGWVVLFIISGLIWLSVIV